MTADERAIRELVDTWMAASTAGDTAKVLSLMTDDVVFMVPGMEPFGKAEFAAASASQAGMRIDGTARIVELQVLGDWAFIRNYIDISVTPPGATQAVRRAGYTLTLLHRDAGGRWLLARDANFVDVKK
ncbi:YybH family protein [Paraburkholderia dinghuensis]|uniref:SgcJ/EcaC family oxidoreductase n=1 Tax=Paraburkholderia dinghuensis TaxID=2305225 RepID=A0A3N6MEC5_9BURK|nr:SgcJ/EcaC family oxidoreductase [Paraburkholderia dinghuensis]RQH02239.1 SgcJ/EcaC family oxidoreductase [Paraburkholderia dinghuensis]